MLNGVIQMEVKRYDITDAIKVYITPIQKVDGSKREAEKFTEKSLLNHLFGADITLSHNQDGKPKLENSSLHISLSHTKTLLCLAVSKQAELGVDIEDITERLRRVQSKFAPEISREYSLQELAIIWSAKEAVYKLVGARAGAIGEHVSVNFSDMRRGKAAVGDENICLQVVELTTDYEIVLATYECV